MYPLIACTGLDCPAPILPGIQDGEGRLKQLEQHMQKHARVKLQKVLMERRAISLMGQGILEEGWRGEKKMKPHSLRAQDTVLSLGFLSECNGEP